jgi:hypothetical protein
MAFAGVTAAGIGTVAYSQAYRPHSNALTTTLTEGTFLTANKSAGNDTFRSVAVPTLEATGRVLRLARTAALMALDYKLANNEVWQALTDEPQVPMLVSEHGEDRHLGTSGHDERDYWEAEAERRRGEFERAQEVYSTESHPQLDVHARLEAKRHEKARMKRAALALAEAEEELSRRGSSKSRVHRRAAHRLLQLCQTNKGVYIKGTSIRIRGLAPH